MVDLSRMAWLCSIEYLSKFEQLDPSILHDLIDEAPELSEDFGNSTREMVALRCLEQLLGTGKEVAKDVHSVTQPKDALDFSKSCEDVLHSVVNKRPVLDSKRLGGDLLTWEIRPFIMHKRASMPKCAIEKLKDRILEGTHPYTASLMELSGLVQKKGRNNDRITMDYGSRNAPARGIKINGSDSQIMAPETSNVSLSHENWNGMVEGHINYTKFLPGKRKVSGEYNEHLAEDHQEVQEGDISLNVKRFKCDMSCANNMSEEHVLAQYGNGLVEDSSEMMVRREGKGICHVDGESPVGGSSECMYSKNTHYKFVATENLGRSPTANANGESGVHQCENDNRGNNLLSDSSENRPFHCNSIDEVNTAEPSASNDEPFMGTRQKDLVGGRKDNSDSGNQVTSANAVSLSKFSRRITAGSSPQHLYEEGTSSDGNERHHERVDVELEKRCFFSSRCTLNHVSQENWTELSLCIKCCTGGQLLVCSAVGCPLVVHEKCLGSSPRFDEKGEFYCPFCAYSHAISEYLKAKKKASLARKELSVFISTRTKRSRVKECDRQNQDGGCLHLVPKCGNLEEKESDQANNMGHVNKVNEQLKERQGDRHQMEPVISDSEINLIGREKEPDLAIIERETSGEGNENKVISNYSMRSRGRQMQHVSHYPAPPLLRRKKNPWTTEEEQMLKEGVQKFSGVSDRTMPWVKILEYGSMVFVGRTAVDLKDKWRNMCKATSKPR